MQSQTINQKVQPAPHYLRVFYAASGIVATIAYRITFLLNPLWAKIIWYVGTVGFIIYFWHRMKVETKRANLVRDYQLIESVENSNINPDQKVALSYIVGTSLTSKVRFDSAFIFWASVLALMVSAGLDIYHYGL